MSIKGTNTVEAAADLSAIQYHIMRLSAVNKCNMSSNAADSDMCGILQNKPQSGEPATIQYFGPGRAVAGATVTAGDHITCDGSGRAITVTSGSMSLGQALETGASGNTIDIVQYYPVRWAGAP